MSENMVGLTLEELKTKVINVNKRASKEAYGYNFGLNNLISIKPLYDNRGLTFRFIGDYSAIKDIKLFYYDSYGDTCKIIRVESVCYEILDQHDLEDPCTNDYLSNVVVHTSYNRRGINREDKILSELVGLTVDRKNIEENYGFNLAFNDFIKQGE